jgi:hypothetical protein
VTPSSCNGRLQARVPMGTHTAETGWLQGWALETSPPKGAARASRCWPDRRAHWHNGPVIMQADRTPYTG